MRLLDDLLADRRDRDLDVAALEQLHAELFLEFLDRDRERRLADEAGFGRAPEVALPGDRDDVLQFGERHGAMDDNKRAHRGSGFARREPGAIVHTGTMSRARLIGLDWGTSTLRAYRYADDGAVLERREQAMGIAAISDGRFRDAFESLCADWLHDGPQVAVIACGMIGSRQGWSEAPYLPTPAGFRELAAGLVRIDALAGRRFAIVPGVQTTNDAGTRDVMRGEETQLFGACAQARGDAAGSTALHGPAALDGPGLVGRRAARRPLRPAGHAQQVGQHARGPDRRVSNLPDRRTVRGARAALDPWAVVRAASTARATRRSLTRPRRAATAPPDSTSGWRRAASDPAGLGALLFSVRSEGLFAALAPDALPEYLSGLLIGAEIAHALGPEHAGPASGGAAPISIVGADRLAERYRRALALLGARAAVVAGEPAARALASIAREGGLID